MFSPLFISCEPPHYINYINYINVLDDIDSNFLAASDLASSLRFASRCLTSSLSSSGETAEMRCCRIHSSSQNMAGAPARRGRWRLRRCSARGRLPEKYLVLYIYIQLNGVQCQPTRRAVCKSANPGPKPCQLVSLATVGHTSDILVTPVCSRRLLRPAIEKVEE